MFYNRGVSFNTPKFERALSGYQSRGRTTIIQQNNYGVGSGMFGVGMPPIVQPKVGFLGGLGVALGTALNFFGGRMFGGMGGMDAMGGMGMIGGYPCIGGIGGAKAQGNEQQSDEQIAANLMRAYPDYNITQGKGGWILTSKDGKETFLDKATIGQVQDEIVKRSKNNKNAPTVEESKAQNPENKTYTEEDMKKLAADKKLTNQDGKWVDKDGKEYEFKEGEFKPKDSKPAADPQGTNGTNPANDKDKTTSVDTSKYTQPYIVKNGQSLNNLLTEIVKAKGEKPTKENLAKAKKEFMAANPNAVHKNNKGQEYLLAGAQVKVPNGTQGGGNTRSEEIDKYNKATAKGEEVDRAAMGGNITPLDAPMYDDD